MGSTVGSANVSTLNLNGTMTLASFLAQTNSTSANVINIGSGSVVTVSGASIVGFATSITSPTPSTSLTISGNELDLNNTLTIGQAESGSSTRTTNILNMSGLLTFKMNATGSGQAFNMSTTTQTNSTVTLANTANTINTNTINVGATTANAGTGTLNLGGGTNVLEATTFAVGTGKATGIIQFAGSGGSITIAGINGTGAAPNMDFGRDTSATSSSAKSSMNIAGHLANITAGNITLGSQAGNTAGTGIGNITFDTGTFTVNNLTMGIDSSGTSTSGARGAFYLGGLTVNPSATGVLTVNTSLVLGNNTNTAASGPTHGAFVVNGGTGNIGSDITTAGTQGSRTSSIVLAGGTLNMQGHQIGTSAAPITNVGLTVPGQTATLMNLGGGGINGSGGLTLQIIDVHAAGHGNADDDGELLRRTRGAGTLVLGGNNTYTGDTNVNSGTLSVAGTPASQVIFGGGNLVGTGTINSLVTLNSGNLGAGAALNSTSGTLTLANGLTVNGGNFAFAIGSSSAPLVNVTGGAVTFGGGTITLSLAPGATPTNGSSFNVLTSATTFDATALSLNPTTIGRTTLTPSVVNSNSIIVTIGGSAGVADVEQHRGRRGWDDMGQHRQRDER